MGRLRRYVTATEERASAFRARVEQVEIDPDLIGADEISIDHNPSDHRWDQNVDRFKIGCRFCPADFRILDRLV
jgi:hypothetical protein